MEFKENIGMYANTKTWNPFKGCHFDCVYCKPSFQRQAKRQKHNCPDCYDYVPHYHPERLRSIPSSQTVFVCGNADISFCDPDYTRQIIEAIRDKNRKHPEKIYYFQTKRPEYFNQFIGEFPENAILLITLETNRDTGYERISKAPIPSERYRQFMALDHSRKVLTIEPIMDFDLDVFSTWITDANPEYIWMGYNSKPKSCQLPEPSMNKFQALWGGLNNAGIEIKVKKIRG